MKISSLIKQRLDRMKTDFKKLYDSISYKQIEIDDLSKQGDSLIVDMEKIVENKNIGDDIKYISLNEKVLAIHKITTKIKKCESEIKDSIRIIGDEKNIIVELIMSDNKNISKKEIDKYLSNNLKMN